MTTKLSAPSIGARFSPGAARKPGAIGRGNAGMARPLSPVTWWANRPRPTKCGSAKASCSEATTVAQQSAAANSGCQYAAVSTAMILATASFVAVGSARSLARSGASPMAVTKDSQNFCSRAAQATSLPSLVG